MCRIKCWQQQLDHYIKLEGVGEQIQFASGIGLH